MTNSASHRDLDFLDRFGPDDLASCGGPDGKSPELRKRHAMTGPQATGRDFQDRIDDRFSFSLAQVVQALE